MYQGRGQVFLNTILCMINAFQTLEAACAHYVTLVQSSTGHDEKENINYDIDSYVCLLVSENSDRVIVISMCYRNNLSSSCCSCTS